MKVRPHEIYRIDDEVLQWTFDKAVLRFGGALEAELEKVSRDSKKRASAERKMNMIFEKWMSSGEDAVARKFQDPMDTIKRR